MKTVIKTCALLAVLLASQLCLAAAPAKETGETSAPQQSQMKDFFPVGVWFDGRVEGINCSQGYHNVPRDMKQAEAYYEKNFRDMKEHNLDLVVIPNTPPEYRETLLSVADRVGLRVVLELVELAYPQFGGRHSVRSTDMVQDEKEVTAYCEKVIAPLRNHPSLLCYQVLDEPPANLFKNFSLVSRALTQLDPAHPSFSCLCNARELGRTTAMGTQMIIFDRYPLRKPSKPGDYDFKAFGKLLDTIDHHAGEKPYWMALQSCAMDTTSGLRYPTSEEVRLMTWQSLAHNAKGIFFFLHNSYTQHEKLQGLVDLEMRPHPIYGEVADLARMLKRISPVVLGLSRADSAVKAQPGFDVQGFRDKQGRSYTMIVNLDVKESATFKGEYTGQAAALDNIVTGQHVVLETDSGSKRFTAEIPAGGGCFLAEAK